MLGLRNESVDDADIDSRRAALDAMSARWERQQPAVGAGMAIFRAGDFDTDARRARAALWEAATSIDIDRRKRAVWALARFGELVPGLPPGRLEPTFGTAAVAREPAPEVESPGDLAWVAETVILPLEQLGAGAQVVCGVLATLALQPAAWIALEEPESHLHGDLQHELARLIAATVAAPTPLLRPRQVFIATHSPAFAETPFDIRLLQHDGAQTSVQTLSREAAVGFAAVANGDSQPQSPPSLLNYDGTIRLPDFVLEKYAGSKGQFLYFVDDRADGFKLMTEAEMDAYLGDGEP